MYTAFSRTAAGVFGLSMLASTAGWWTISRGLASDVAEISRSGRSAVAAGQADTGPASDDSSASSDALDTPRATTVQVVPRERVLAISQRIDQLVDEGLLAAGQARNKPLSDEAFVRRVYLDIAGRIPTLQEIDAFETRRAANRRPELIDDLLDSRGYVSHWFHFWADILRAKSRLAGQNPGQPYVDYIEQTLADNKPYDRFVSELLTASGSILDRGNGAVGYYLRDFGMPEDNMANTVRVFLGTRIECAQCHDHPFDRWKQRDFFEMVAFTGGLRMRMKPAHDWEGPQLRKRLQDAGATGRETQIAIRLLRSLTYGVQGSGTGLARLPDFYQSSDGEPNEIIIAKTMFEHQPLVAPRIPPAPQANPRKRPRDEYLIPGAKDVNSRGAFAAWLTSPANPRFALVIANRLWRQALGVGLIAPVDDLHDDTQASNPALMDYLTRQMIELGFDMKQYLRAIYNSQTYQSEATAAEVDDSFQYRFPGPLVRRMSPEQLWDSYLTLAIPDLDQRWGGHRRLDNFSLGAASQQEAFERFKSMTLEEVVQVAKHRAELESSPAKMREFNRAQLAKGLEGEFSDIAAQQQRFRDEIQQLREALQQARDTRRPFAARTVQARIRELQRQLRFLPGRFPPDLVRASELPSPANPNHFLREFGQSDREQIEGASVDPTINQALALMNGTIDQRIISNSHTLIMQNMAAAESPAIQIDAIYRTILSRHPTRAERNLWLGEGKKYGSEAVTDLIWTLANSSEFIFIR